MVVSRVILNGPPESAANGDNASPDGGVDLSTIADAIKSIVQMDIADAELGALQSLGFTGVVISDRE